MKEKQKEKQTERIFDLQVQGLLRKRWTKNLTDSNADFLNDLAYAGLSVNVQPHSVNKVMVAQWETSWLVFT